MRQHACGYVCHNATNFLQCVISAALADTRSAAQWLSIAPHSWLKSKLQHPIHFKKGYLIP